MNDDAQKTQSPPSPSVPTTLAPQPSQSSQPSLWPELVLVIVTTAIVCLLALGILFVDGLVDWPAWLLPIRGRIVIWILYLSSVLAIFPTLGAFRHGNLVWRRPIHILLGAVIYLKNALVIMSITALIPDGVALIWVVVNLTSSEIQDVLNREVGPGLSRTPLIFMGGVVGVIASLFLIFAFLGAIRFLIELPFPKPGKNERSKNAV